MNENYRLFFELGLVYSRLRRLCYERGVVRAESGIEDYLKALVEMLDEIPVKESVKSEIRKDAKKIEEIIQKYSKDERLSEADSRTILSIINKWRNEIFQDTSGETEHEMKEVKDALDSIQQRLEKIESELYEVKDEINKLEKEKTLESGTNELLYKMGMLSASRMIKEGLRRKIYELTAKAEKQTLDEIQNEIRKAYESENLKEEIEKMLNKLSKTEEYIKILQTIMDEIDKALTEEIKIPDEK